MINGKCLSKNYCSHDVNCIVVSYKPQVSSSDDINIGLFSLEEGTLLYKFDET